MGVLVFLLSLKCFHLHARKNSHPLIHHLNTTHQEDGVQNKQEHSLYMTPLLADNNTSCTFSVLSVVIYCSITRWRVFVKQTGL